MNTRYRVLFVLVIFLVLTPVISSKALASECRISPQNIRIGSFFRGADLLVTGAVPAGCEVAVVVTGESKEHALSRKGKVAMMWMNVGTIHIKNIPEFYYLLTSSDDIPQAIAPQSIGTPDLGYDALRKTASIEQAGGDEDLLFQEFIKFKETTGLYKIMLNSVRLEPLAADTVGFTATCPIPASVPQGQYQVSVYSFNGGELMANTSAALTVANTGFPEKISNLAYNQPALYGIFAIAVAIGAGLLMGFLFGSKAKGGH
jgi:uncharacterized protein (TIGR02186 family)